MRRLLPILPLHRRPAVARAGARITAPDRDLRGTARAALGLHARGHARPDQRLRRNPDPPARLLARLRARPRQQDAPQLRRVGSERLSRRQVGQPRRAGRGRQGARHRGHADAHRPGAALGDARQEGQPLLSGPEGVRRVRDRDGPPLRRLGQHVVDLERAQPAAVPQAAVQERQAVLAEALPQALPGGLRRAALDAGQRRRHDPDRRDLAARQRERRPPARVPARDALPGLQVPQGEVVRRARGRRLRAPRLHDERRAALQARRHRRRDDRRALAPDHRARQGGEGRRAAREAAGPPDRVRYPVDARQGRPASRSPARSRTSPSPSTWPTSTRASSRSRST